MFESGTRRGSKRLWPAMMALVVVVPGCAGDQPSSSAALSVPVATAPVAATRSPLPSPTPLAGLPAGLIGTWETDLTQYLDPDPLCPNCGAETRLLIRAHGQYAIAGYGPYRPGGGFVMLGDLIRFDRSARAGETDCAEATYSYELDGDRLTFSAVKPDPCGRRGEALNGVTYTRAE